MKLLLSFAAAALLGAFPAFAQSNPRVGSVFVVGANTNTANSYTDAQRVVGDLGAALGSTTNWFASFTSNKVYFGQLAANVDLTLTNLPTSTNVDRSIYVTVIGDGTRQVRLLNTPVNSYGSTNWVVPPGVWTSEARWVLGQLYWNPQNRLSQTDGILLQDPAYGVTNVTLGTGLSMSGSTLNGGFGQGATTIGSVFLTNSTSEVNVFDIPIAGGTLGTNRAINVDYGVFFFNQSGSAVALTNRVYYDDTLIYDGTMSTISSQATARIIRGQLVLSGAGSTSAQRLSGNIAVSVNGTGLTVGTGPISGTAPTIVGVFGGTAAEDSTTTKNIRLSWQSNVASANTYAILYHAYAR